ncbi:MAG: TetR family transcriptional regulator C-terminal domain-containing protein [Chloroflexi bacterium]|nr:TetR family transcriptional regulator C-terminal domain-containing protein [Chloroflexota bacterium]
MLDEPALFEVLTEVSLRAHRTPVLQYLDQQHSGWHDMLAGILRRGIEERTWSTDLDPDAAAWAIITMMEGASMWAATSPGRGEQAMMQLEKWLQIR